MTEDKPIIIDGVDVSGCDLLRYDYFPFDDKGYDTCSGAEIDICRLKCKDNPNCIYKQLQREKQKNEKLEKDLKYEKELCRKYIDSRYEYILENEQLKTENEQLRKKLKNLFDIDNQIVGI